MEITDVELGEQPQTSPTPRAAPTKTPPQKTRRRRKYRKPQPQPATAVGALELSPYMMPQSKHTHVAGIIRDVNGPSGQVLPSKTMVLKKGTERLVYYVCK